MCFERMFILVFGTIHRTLFIDTIHRCAARWICDVACVEPSMVRCLCMHWCMCACVLEPRKMPKAFGLGLGWVKCALDLTWVLGVAWALAWIFLLRGDRLVGLSLSLALSFSRPLSPEPKNALDTIHPLAFTLFSLRVRPPFRVGFAGKLLPVSGYAWTPRSWETVVVLLLGFGKRIRFEVSGPYRAKLTVEIGLLLLFGILLLCFLVSLDGIGSWMQDCGLCIRVGKP